MPKRTPMPEVVEGPAMAIRNPSNTRQYDYSFLSYFINRDGATLIGEYPTFNHKTNIDFICKCGIGRTRPFIYISEPNGINGALCDKCRLTRRNNIKQGIESAQPTEFTFPIIENPYYVLQTVEEANDRRRNTYDMVMACIKRDEAILTGKYESMCSDTMITFICKCGKPHIKRLNYIADKTGAICEKCAQPITFERATNTLLEQNPGKTMDDIHKEWVESAQATSIKKYGEIHYSKTEQSKENYKQAFLRKYGANHPMKVPAIKLKQINTCLKRYNVHTTLLVEKFREKALKTNVERYGYEYPIQSPQIAKKQNSSALMYKTYISPTGVIHRVQGYEPHALKDLFTTVSESDIITGCTSVPNINYIFNNKNRIYYPDIYIKSQNKLIEVKSTWTYISEIQQNNAKALACLNKGYQFEFWIYCQISRKKFIRKIITHSQSVIIELNKSNISHNSTRKYIRDYTFDSVNPSSKEPLKEQAKEQSKELLKEQPKEQPKEQSDKLPIELSEANIDSLLKNEMFIEKLSKLLKNT
jgi:hypothetical protein